jgi:hypothetical protein
MRITGKPGLITSLVGFDDISTIPDGTYDLVDNSTGTGGTVTMSGGAIASFTPGSGYSLGDVYAEGYGNRFTVSSIAPSGTRITGGIRFVGVPTASLYIPTVAPANLFVGEAVFEMGAYNPFVDPALVPDLSGYDHSMGLNNNDSGNANWYHFYNNSAQANDWSWPTVDGHALTLMGWFAFASFNPGGSTSLITRTEGISTGWALRVDDNGSTINLVKYGSADQTVALNTPLTTNTWHFISVSQLENLLIFNINGTTYVTTGSSTPFTDDGGSPVRLQYDPYTSGNQNIEMWMRDIKILPFGYDATWLLNYYNTLKVGYGYSSSPTGVVVSVIDLGSVTSSNLSGADYIYGGGYDYIIFTGDTPLENNLQAYLSMSAGNGADFIPFAATWASGQTGYVFMEYTSDPVVQFYPCDVSGNPIAPGIYTFPVTISRV